ncbi:hypothetical protein ACO0LD_11355 [Undibacterium sp. Ji83W]|uniref:hypothetical protein n=1 Tax=Undibacterium sp. Ji83W TaxID=3413043 RepID=UPI003BF447D2
MTGPSDKPGVVPSTAEKKLDKILDDFGNTNKTANNNPGEDLRKVLDASPDLKKRILDSVDKGYLSKFQALPPNSGTGGSYDPSAKAINVPMDALKGASTNPRDKAELIFVMGHEIQHSFNAAATRKITQDFLDGTTTLAKSKASPHDYTKLTEDFIQSSRKDEASAHIGGFNAIVSQARKDNPNATLKDIYNTHQGRMQDFIDVTGSRPNFNYAMKPGLTIDADMTMSSSKDNISAMGKYYFDKPGNVSKLGSNHNLDYTNFYGSWAANVAGNNEKAYQDYYHKTDKKYVTPEVQFDMKRLGLQQDLINQNVKFSDNKAFSYVDTSDGKKKPATFDPSAHPNPSPPVSPVTNHAQERDSKRDLIDATTVPVNSSKAVPLLPAKNIADLLMGDDTPSSRLLRSVPESLKAAQAKPG